MRQRRQPKQKHRCRAPHKAKHGTVKPAKAGKFGPQRAPVAKAKKKHGRVRVSGAGLHPLAGPRRAVKKGRKAGRPAKSFTGKVRPEAGPRGC